MTFWEDMPDGSREWGCPSLSRFGAGWFIDWYSFNGIHTGSSLAKGDALAWIISHPAEVAQMQADVAAWVGRELDKVIPF